MLLDRVDWVVPQAVSTAMWARAGMSSEPFSFLEGDLVRMGLPGPSCL